MVLNSRHVTKSMNSTWILSIEIPPFRPFLWCKFPKNFGLLRIFFFALQYIKNWTEVVPWTFFFSWKNKLLVWKKLLLKYYEVRSERGDFNWCWFCASKVCTLMLRWYLSPSPTFFSDWLWPYCGQQTRFQRL